MKKVYNVFNKQRCFFKSFTAVNYKSALKQANKQGYYIRNGFKISEQ